MKKSFLFAFIGAAICLSCAKENYAPEDTAKTVITVGIENTKTTIGESESGKRKIYWTNGDKLNANGVSSEALSGIGEKQTSASFVFQGSLSKPYKFLYPASYYKTAGTISLPSAQDTTVADIPMYGYSDSGLQADLKVLTAALQISLRQGTDTDNIKYIQLSSETQPLSGTFSIDYQTGTITSTAAAADSKIRLSANCALSTEEAKTFVFSIPAGSYGLTVKVVDVNAHCMTKTLTGKTFTAGNYIILPELVFAPTTTEFDIHITNAEEWNAFANSYNNGELDTRCLVQIDNDIDCSKTKAVALNSFSGVLDGGSSSFLSLDKPLIKSVNKTGVVRNVVIDENSSFTVDVEDANARYGFIVNSNYGTITGCTVKGNIGFEVANGSASAAGFFGGIAGRSFGDISGCTYSGTMSNTCATSESRQGYVYVGGITGDANTDEENSVSTGNVKDCTFSGKILLGVNAGKVDDVSYDGITCANTTGVRIAGIAARIQDSNVVDNCSTTSDALIDVRGSQLVLYAGGISGTAQNTVKNCTNNAKIKVIETSNDISGGNAFIGGIAGRATGTIESCTNSADSLVAKNNNRTNCVGGIVGRADNTATIKSSSNSSAVAQGQIAGRYLLIGGIVGNNESSSWSGTITNTGKVSIGKIPGNAQYSTSKLGGVMGSTTADIDGSNTISNAGEVYFSNTSVKAYNYVSVGGVVGYSSADVKNVKNTGKLTLYTSVAVKPYGTTDPDKQNQYYKYTALGGVVGSTDAAITINGCTNEITDAATGMKAQIDDVVKTASYNTNWCEGGILGYTNAAVTVSDCSNKSYVWHKAITSSRIANRSSFTGGIVGKIDGAAATISGCTNSYLVEGSNSNNSLTIDTAPFLGGIVGAIIGKDGSPAKVCGCSASKGSAKSNINFIRGIAGGIAGYASYALIGGDNSSDGCTVEGKLTSNNNSTYSGGIAGWALNSTVKNCTCTASFDLTKNQGGIVANLDTGSEITDCIFNGTMTKGTNSAATDPKAIASCSVSGTTITNCGLAGTIAGTTISGDNYTSYICNDTNATISNCYFYTK